MSAASVTLDALGFRVTCPRCGTIGHCEQGSRLMAGVPYFAQRFRANGIATAHTCAVSEAVGAAVRVCEEG